MAQVRALLAAGRRSVDIGCMQVNLLHHPDAFSGPEEGFDPAASVRYAIRFLKSLHARSGSWGRRSPTIIRPTGCAAPPITARWCWPGSAPPGPQAGSGAAARGGRALRRRAAAGAGHAARRAKAAAGLSTGTALGPLHADWKQPARKNCPGSKRLQNTFITAVPASLEVFQWMKPIPGAHRTVAAATPGEFFPGGTGVRGTGTVPRLAVILDLKVEILKR
ncbi:hypothetical protein ACFQU2_24000 [Siccirubricoccus deserti]